MPDRQKHKETQLIRQTDRHTELGQIGKQTNIPEERQAPAEDQRQRGRKKEVKYRVVYKHA